MQLLYFVHVASRGLGEIAEFVGDDVGVGHAQDRRTSGLRKGASIDERSIGESRVPGEGIVDRMIDAPGIAIAAESEIRRSHAEMLQERRIVRSRAERADTHVLAIAIRGILSAASTTAARRLRRRVGRRALAIGFPPRFPPRRTAPLPPPFSLP